jgi:hypothetical protein
VLTEIFPQKLSFEFQGPVKRCPFSAGAGLVRFKPGPGIGRLAGIIIAACQAQNL